MANSFNTTMSAGKAGTWKCIAPIFLAAVSCHLAMAQSTFRFVGAPGEAPAGEVHVHEIQAAPSAVVISRPKDAKTELRMVSSPNSDNLTARTLAALTEEAWVTTRQSATAGTAEPA